MDVRPVVTTSNTKANIDITSILPLAESDGTLKFSLYGKVGATLTALSLDDGGELEVTLMGNIASTPTQVELDTGGKLMTVLYGKDSGANIDPLRTNANQELIVQISSPLGTGTPKNLGKVLPAAATETTIYTTPASTTTQIEQIVICNTGVATTFNLGIAVGGGTIGTAEFLFGTTPIAANTTVTIAGPFYLATTDLLRGDSVTGNVCFSAEGIEWA